MFGAALAWSSYMKIYAEIKDHYERKGEQLVTRHIAVASITGSMFLICIRICKAGVLLSPT
jgi:hypothetical protein